MLQGLSSPLQMLVSFPQKADNEHEQYVNIPPASSLRLLRGLPRWSRPDQIRATKAMLITCMRRSRPDSIDKTKLPDFL